MFRKKKIVELKSRGLLEVLLLAILSVVALHIVWQLIAHGQTADNRIITDIANRFGLDQELSVPTWLVSIMAFIVATLAWLIGKAQKNTDARLGWFLVASVGLFISLDEVSALHELLLQGLHILAQFGEGQSFFSNAWLLLLPFIVIALVFGFRYLHRALPRDTFINLAIAGTVYLSGALVVEFLSIQLDKASLSYLIGMVVLEEGLELIGVWLVIRALLRHITVHEVGLRKKLAGLIS